MMDKEILTRLEIEGGIDINVLPAGTKLSVETHHSIYQIEIVNGSKITILGGMLRSGEYRFPTPIPATLSGSVFPFTNMLKLNWLGKDMQMEVALKEGFIRTSPIKGLEFETTDC